MSLQGRNGAPYEIPVELLTYVDEGGNPDAFIVDVIRSAAAANEAAKGKVEAFRYVFQFELPFSNPAPKEDLLLILSTDDFIY